MHVTLSMLCYPNELCKYTDGYKCTQDSAFLYNKQTGKTSLS